MENITLHIKEIMKTSNCDLLSYNNFSIVRRQKEYERTIEVLVIEITIIITISAIINYNKCEITKK